MKNPTKVSILAAAALCSLSAQANNCFVPTQSVPSFVPKKICVDALNIEANQASALVAIGDQAPSKKALEVTSFLRDSENKSAFEAKLNLIRPWSDVACFINESATVKLSGQTDTQNTAEANAYALSLSVSFNYITDVCHTGSLVEQTVEYVQAQ